MKNSGPCASRGPCIRTQKGCAIPSLPVDRLSLTHATRVSVKYELLRRVRVDGYSVSQATLLFALSRPTFYAAQSAWQQAGISGLLPQSTGPRQAHKLTDEIVAELRPLAKTMSAAELARWLQEQRGLIVHPRSIERALARHQRQKGGAS
jgi:transposase